MSKKQELPKPRNPYIAHMLFKVSGSHGKSKKAERKAINEKIKALKNKADFDN